MLSIELFSEGIKARVEERLNLDKLPGIPGGSLMISGAETTGKNLSNDIGNVNNVSEAFVSASGELRLLFGTTMMTRRSRRS